METLKVWMYDKLGVEPKKKKDGFEGEEVAMFGPSFFLIVIGVLLFVVLYSVGAAKLSWCYNSSVGTGTALKLIYAAVAFWFSGFYYPFYAFFVDDNCQVGSIASNTNSGTNTRNTNTPRTNTNTSRTNNAARTNNTSRTNQTGGSRNGRH
jgi:hypothetical protein